MPTPWWMLACCALGVVALGAVAAARGASPRGASRLHARLRARLAHGRVQRRRLVFLILGLLLLASPQDGDLLPLFVGGVALLGAALAWGVALQALALRPVGTALGRVALGATGLALAALLAFGATVVLRPGAVEAGSGLYTGNLIVNGDFADPAGIPDPTPPVGGWSTYSPSECHNNHGYRQGTYGGRTAAHITARVNFDSTCPYPTGGVAASDFRQRFIVPADLPSPATVLISFEVAAGDWSMATMSRTYVLLPDDNTPTVTCEGTGWEWRVNSNRLVVPRDDTSWRRCWLIKTNLQPGAQQILRFGEDSATASDIYITNVRVQLDAYDLLHDCAKCTPWSLTMGDPVNVVGGNFILRQTDLALPGRGLPIDVTRTYNSIDASEAGFGVGWSHPYAMRVDQEVPPTANTVLVRYPDGRRDRFTKVGATSTYAAPAGIFNTLVKNVDDSYTLTTPQQLVFAFDATGRLTSMTDRNANATTLTWATSGLANNTGGLTVAAPGRTVTLSYGPTGANSARFVRLDEVGGVGRAVEYGYSAAGDLTSVTDVRGNLTTMGYDVNHQLLWVVDPNGQATGRKQVENEYDSMGRVIKQWDAKHQLTTFAYDTTARTTTFTDARGHTTVYAYDTARRITDVTTATDGSGNVVTYHYTYDGNNNRTSASDGRTPVTDYDTIYTHDGQGNVLTSTDPLGHTTTYTYNAANDLLTVAVPVASGVTRTTTFGYDGVGNLTTITDPLGKVTTMTYAANGDLTAIEDANGVTVGLGYDGAGLPTSRTATAGGVDHTWTFAYDAGGRLTGATDPLAHAVAYQYNAANQVTQLTDQRNYVTSFAYDLNGNLTGVTDPLTHTWAYAYDELDNLTSVTDPLGHVTSYTYDPNSNRTRITDATSRQTNFTYDRANRLAAVADHAGHTTGYVLDGAGNVTQMTDPNSHATGYAYDTAGRLTTVTDALTHATTYGYNWANQLTSVTDANSHTTSYTYDGAGRPFQRIDPLSNTWATTYDDNGRVHQRTDPNGVAATYAYDGYGRLTGIAYSGGTPPTTTPAVTYGYDAANRRTSMVDGTGTTTYTYDEADHLSVVTPPAGGSVQYGWDNAGRLVRVTHRALGKVYNVTYGYDSANRPTAVTDWLNKTTAYGYDDAGRLASIAYPNGVASAYGYDTAGRLTGVAHAKGATPLASVAYTLDDAGNRLTETAAGVPLAGTTTYTYDALDRLATAAYPDTSTAGWGYDDVGNRTSVTLSGTTTHAAYDNANRLCWADGSTTGTCAAPPSGATTYTNDANGNRTAKVAGGVVTTYGYDAENRLKSVVTGGTTTATYTYDGDGYRVRKQVGAATTTYAWDRLGAGGLGTVVGDGAEYVYGPAGLQQRTVGAASQYAQGDGLGSIRLVTDGAGNATGSATYEPWGAPRSGSATLGGFGFTGEQTDAETGFVYLRARTLDPAIGRFLQEDTYPGSAGDPASTHLFAYGRNNPMRYTDPSGHAPILALAIPVAWGWLVAYAGAALDKVLWRRTLFDNVER